MSMWVIYNQRRLFMKKYIYLILLVIICANTLSACSKTNPVITGLCKQIENADTSLHDKITAFQEIRRMIVPDKKKDMEYYYKALNIIKYIFDNTPPWRLDLGLLTNEDIKLLEGSALAFSLYDLEAGGLGINFESVFHGWDEYLSKGELIKGGEVLECQAKTSDEQLKGVLNMALLSSYVRDYNNRINDGYNDTNHLNYVVSGTTIYKGNAPQLLSLQNKSALDNTVGFKYLILAPREDGAWSLEYKDMLMLLTLDEIPDKEDDVDILICKQTDRGWHYAGTLGPGVYQEMLTTSTDINAYDYRTGSYLEDFNWEIIFERAYN